MIKDDGAEFFSRNVIAARVFLGGHKEEFYKARLAELRHKTEGCVIRMILCNNETRNLDVAGK